MAGMTIREIDHQNSLRLSALKGWSTSYADMLGAGGEVRLRDEMLKSGIRFQDAERLAAATRHEVGEIASAYADLLARMNDLAATMEDIYCKRRAAAT